ncbi:MAG: NUDIX domain-containing protein [Verrucomicrobiae bacterium]|nr:NUDIX domain-containing protein [Verrucomicrobiae bacterium]
MFDVQRSVFSFPFRSRLAVRPPRPSPRRVSEEVFDVVNERDEVIGRAPRSEVHRRNLRHRAVHVLLFNHRGELFLQQRSLTKDNWPGVWDSSSSGHLDAGEDYDACVLREVREELGIALASVPARILRLDATEETGWEFCWVYRAEHEGPFQLQESEVRGGAWFSPAAIRHWIQGRPDDFASCFRVLWAQLPESGGGRGDTDFTDSHGEERGPSLGSSV